MFARLLRRRGTARVEHVGRRRWPFRLWADTRGAVSYIEYIVILGFVGLAAIGGFKRLRATTWNTVRAQGIAFREIGGAGDIAPVTLAKANVPKMPLAGIGPSGDGKIHLPIIQPQCFAAGTPVATEAGLRPIESIAVGERVWARNELTGEDALAEVVQRFVTPDSPVIGVDIPLGLVRHELLRVTENHRFYVPDRGWVAARELDGSLLVSIAPRGPPLASASAVESWGERTTVYNLEVEALHTYFVGEARVLVHNANAPGVDCTGADPNEPAKRIPNRDTPRIENGNAKEGWIHIDARHVTGDDPKGPGDLFAPGTTRAQIEQAARTLVKKGLRITDPSKRIQIFEKVITVNGKTEMVQVVVDSDDGNRVITIYPARGGG
jgi:Flp pilus assembly pilin Flp